MTATFEQLNLHPQIVKAIEEMGYQQPTEIQNKSIPKILEGGDVRAAAQTGTGKTGAFLLPTLHRLVTTPAKKGSGPRALILAPTRELAMQIATQSEQYSKYLEKIKTVCIGGGVPYPVQMRKLARPYEILVATPGRLIDYIQRGKINFSRLEMLILDEADRMLDMGFIEAVEQIVSLTPKEKQTLLFSATMQGSVLRLSEKLLQNPQDIIASTTRVKHENIKQSLYYVDDVGHKSRLLERVLQEEGMECVIVFTATKRYADQLVDELYEKGYQAAALHGDMSQKMRTKTMTRLRSGKVKILIATDVAARGIDLQSITHVVNFDLPRNAEDYVHRIGRTGRAGAKGIALSFAEQRDAILVKRIEAFTGHPMDVSVIEGLEPKRFPEKGKERQRPSFGLNKRFKEKRSFSSFGAKKGKAPFFKEKKRVGKDTFRGK